MGRGVLFELDEDLLFLFGPSVEGDFVAFETEPLEEAGVGSGAGDEGGDEFPTLVVVVDFVDG